MSQSDSFRREVLVRPAKAGAPYSVAMGCGPFVFLSGLVGRDPATGDIAQGDIFRQTDQTLKNLAARLEEAGSSLQHVLKVTVFITDMGLFGRMNEAYVAHFKGDPPARSCVQVVRLPDPDALVEIELVAVRQP